MNNVAWWPPVEKWYLVLFARMRWISKQRMRIYMLLVASLPMLSPNSLFSGLGLDEPEPPREKIL